MSTVIKRIYMIQKCQIRSFENAFLERIQRKLFFHNVTRRSSLLQGVCVALAYLADPCCRRRDGGHHTSL